MAANKAIRNFLLVYAIPLALVITYLGWKVSSTNMFGWLMMSAGIGYLFVAPFYVRYRSRQNPILREEIGDRSFWLILPGFLAIFFLSPLEFLYLPATLPQGNDVQIPGLLLIGLGLLMVYDSMRLLRELFTGHVQIQTEHRLVQAGIYRYMRHPCYAGYILITLGFSIGFTSRIGLIALVFLLVPGLLYRMNVEEGLLKAQFGDQYNQYTRQTKRLIPWLW
jgi:protein-S-isoprenylcysteine O-methyltransferase Ste14